MMANTRIRILDTAVLSDSWAHLSKITFDYQRDDGQWQRQVREVYNRGDGAAILLYNQQRRTVVLIKQFRMPVYLSDSDGFMVEVPAGVLEQNNPELTVQSEAEQETGYRVQDARKLFSAYVSPGSITEQIHYFCAAYTSDQKVSEGGGLDSEGEDIEVMEVLFDDAMEWIKTGQIEDSKTIVLLQYAALNLFNA